MTTPLPGPLAPMLAVPGPMPAEAEGWSFEVKWDGMRAVVHCPGDGNLTVRSRTLRDVTALWPELSALPRALGAAAVLDGELVAFDAAGRPSFERLQPRIQATAASAHAVAALQPVVYVVFDLLWIDGEDVCASPYNERRERLGALGLDGDGWRAPAALAAVDTEALEAAVRGLGLEGVVAKRSDSQYLPGVRSRSWRKVKFLVAQEFAVGGWAEGAGGGLGSLALGVHDEADGRLRYCGRVGTGFSDAERERLAAAFEPLAVDVSPFAPGPSVVAGLHWVRPEVVVEVAFAEWTSGGVLRHPTYRGRRLDKPASEVVRET